MGRQNTSFVPPASSSTSRHPPPPALSSLVLKPSAPLNVPQQNVEGESEQPAVRAGPRCFKRRFTPEF